MKGIKNLCCLMIIIYQIDDGLISIRSQVLSGYIIHEQGVADDQQAPVDYRPKVINPGHKLRDRGLRESGADLEFELELIVE